MAAAPQAFVSLSKVGHGGGVVQIHMMLFGFYRGKSAGQRAKPLIRDHTVEKRAEGNLALDWWQRGQALPLDALPGCPDAITPFGPAPRVLPVGLPDVQGVGVRDASLLCLLL